jgi:hypothetical protein
MATNQYSDIFMYEYISVFNIISKYTNVTLLKDFDGHVSGSKFDYVHLNLKTGKFEFSPVNTRVTRSETMAAKTLVEFKGVHTRFTDDSTESDEDISNEVDTSPEMKTYTLKLYENKRKLLRQDSDIKSYFLNDIQLATKGKVVSQSTGPRGELLVTIETPNTLMGTMVPFVVSTARNRSIERYYSVLV